jgi:hypothetical protein
MITMSDCWNAIVGAGVLCGIAGFLGGITFWIFITKERRRNGR